MFWLLLFGLTTQAAFTILPDPLQDSVTDYAPTINVQCPDPATLLREIQPLNQSLHPQETEYIENRENFVLPNRWKAWLGDGKDLGYNISQFEGHWARVGIAVPGGGLRASQYGAAAMIALDSRDPSAEAAGTGGLLQVTSYITGLSGGSWLLGSLMFNNWPNITDLVFGDGKDLSGWLLDLNLVSPDGLKVISDKNQAWFGSILWSVAAKANTGIDTSFTDPWSRMIAYHFLNQTTRDNFFTNNSAHGAGQLWSNIPDIPTFREHNAPFPILVTDSRPSGSNSTGRLSLNSTVYEISPLEFGSFDSSLTAFMNISYAGTQLTLGKPANDTACVTGFDQASFMMGTSASLFNQIFDTAENAVVGVNGMENQDDSNSILYLAQRHLRMVRTRADDVANWPNPFTGLKPDTFQDSRTKWLEFLDGATNQENTPFNPLFVKSRKLDVIVALENSQDDANSWPNGTSIVVSAQRQALLLKDTHQSFPPIPNNTADFVSTGISARTTFFGCDPTENPPEYPLVIMLNNAPPINGDNPVTNTATFKLSYTRKHADLFFKQVFNNVVNGYTPFSNTPDAKFGVCLKCAALDRARLKVSPVIPRSDACTACFTQYCFNPANPPSVAELPGRKYAFVDPDPKGVSKITTFLNNNKFKLIGGLIGLIIFIGLLIGVIIWRRRRAEKKANYVRVKDVVDDDAIYKKYLSQSYVLPDYKNGGSSPGFTAASQHFTAATENSPNNTKPRESYYYDPSRATGTTAVN